MEIKVNITFKNGRTYTSKCKNDFFGSFDIGNGMTFSPHSGVLYREESNIICGEDITNEVEKIELVYEY